MVWVRSEYAGELAVLSAWLSLLIPWNVTLVSTDFGNWLYVRFPLFQARYTGVATNFTDGIQLTPHLYLMDPLTAIAVQNPGHQQLAYYVWTVGAAVIGVAFGLSLAYYFAEERVEAASVDPVRAMGVLLGSAGVVFAASTYFLLTGGLPGVPIPIGILFLFVFSGILLTVDRAEFEADEPSTD